MSASLVGSEMCIRDRVNLESMCRRLTPEGATYVLSDMVAHFAQAPEFTCCLLYTSDAADDM
eukprot:1949825-Alexandrium_andersonii.AAC.1